MVHAGWVLEETDPETGVTLLRFPKFGERNKLFLKRNRVSGNGAGTQKTSTPRVQKCRAKKKLEAEQARAAAARADDDGADRRALTELSGGQLQRAYVARALAQQASVVLLDEALSGVDQPSTHELLEVFEALAAGGTTVLVATHDLALVRRRFRRCLAVNGSLRADGAPTEVLTTEVLERTFGSSDALAH